MQKWHYQVPIKGLSKPTSIKEYLKKHLLIPKHFIYPLRREKRVLVNQEYITMNSLVQNGDEIDLTFIEDDFALPVQNLIADDSNSIDVLYEDEDILVVNKPAGYKTHPNQPGELNTVLNFCEAYLNGKNQHAYMIHRLDQQTSGALIVGKNPVVVPILVRLIKDKVINRIYTAAVDGQFK
ncbi:MAG: pseudouridine synthase, partial [Apilactobacillus sp.]|nr:pseudouridine synthase [Apilactobacillus sp.]